MNYFYSPISRHIVFDLKHYTIYIIHDCSCFLTLFLFIFLYCKKSKFHSLIGTLTIIPLTISIISGFLLIYSKTFITEKDKLEYGPIYSITFFTQGSNIILISLNAFFIHYIRKYKYLLNLLVYFHFYDLYFGIKSFIFLLNNIIYSHNKDIVEKSFELVVILSIPHIFNEIIYLYNHYLHIKTLFKYFEWKRHHQRSVIFLIQMSMPSILFSIVHDKYWLSINNYLTNVFIRIFFMLVPPLFFLYTTLLVSVLKH